MEKDSPPGTNTLTQAVLRGIRLLLCLQSLNRLEGLHQQSQNELLEASALNRTVGIFDNQLSFFSNPYPHWVRSIINDLFD